MVHSDLGIPAFLDRRQQADLPALTDLIDDAARTLANAHSAAEVLDAKEKAGLAYDAAKRAARLSKAKDAHNVVVAAAHRAQARALEIEAGAKRRLADEYDAAQERGEIRQANERTASKPEAVGAGDLGLSHKEIHEAREIRDAEKASPGVVKRALDEAIEQGEEPTKAKIRRAVRNVRGRRRQAARTGPVESQHDRDLRMLVGVWEAACQSARDEFQKLIQQGAI